MKDRKKRIYRKYKGYIEEERGKNGQDNIKIYTLIYIRYIYIYMKVYMYVCVYI